MDALMMGLISEGASVLIDLFTGVLRKQKAASVAQQN
jgi:hypothetical protein